MLPVPVTSGRTYLVQQVAAPTTALPFAQVTGSAPTAARHLGGVQLGLDGPVATGTATVGTVLASANRDYGLADRHGVFLPGTDGLWIGRPG